MNNTPMNSPTLQELPDLRRRTEQVSQILKEQIAGHIGTLHPLISPERLLGKYAGGKIEVSGAERALAELQQAYKPFTTKPFDLPQTLDHSWLALVGKTVEFHPWEYIHLIKDKPITITSPVKWVLSYRANYSPAQAARVVGGREAGRPEYLRQFVVNALLLKLAVTHNAGLVQLFGDLRYELKTETSPELKNLPLVTLTSSLKSFRPADELIEAATAFSGVSAFIELVDMDAAQALPDPLWQRIQEVAKQSGSTNPG